MVVCEVAWVEHVAGSRSRLVVREVVDVELVVEILTLVCKHKEVGFRCEVQAVDCVVPDHRLDNLRQRKQEPLLEDRVTDLVGVFNWLVVWVLPDPLLLLEVDLCEMILLNLLEEVEPGDDDLFSHE